MIIKKVKLRSSDVKQIYFDTFPKKERMPFPMMVAMSKLWKTDFFSFYDGDTLCGFIYLAHNRNIIFVMFFAVDEKLRSKGYGKQMLQLGLKFAFELYGALKVTLEVFENNPSAYHCYKAVGFIENGYSVTYNICNEEWKSIEMEICK